MQNVSEQYKLAMKQPLRNRSTILVSIGEVNPTAQMSAHFMPEYSNEMYYHTADDVVKGGGTSFYSTLEQDFTPADGSMFFVPRQSSGLPYLHNGYTSYDLMGLSTSSNNPNCTYFFDEVTYPFVTTVEFEENGCPDSALIYFKWDNDLYYGWSNITVTDNKIRVKITSKPAAAQGTIKGVWIKGYKTNENTRRMRIKRITFGDGTCIFPDIIEKTEQKNYVSKIDENLPTSELSVNLINYESRYDADNPDNPLAILDANKQPINIYYGYDIDGNETYEWLHGGSFMSDSWNSGKHKATILAKDKLQYNENLFIHNNGNLGRYARAGYWLEAIMNELGYGSNDYIYDTDMDNIVMDLSLVHTIPAKEVLQQLANYCCKTLYIDNEGKLVISSATNITNETVEYTEDINVTSASYSEQITGTLSTTYDRVMARVVISGVRAYTDSVDVSGSDYSYDFVPRYGVGKYQVSIVGLKDGDTPDFEITSNDILDDIEITKEELIKEVIVPFYTPYYVEYDGELQIADEQITVSELPYNYVKLLGDTIYTGLYIEITDSTPLISQSDLTQQTSTRLRGGTTDISIDQQYLFEIEAGFKIKQIIEQNSSTATLNTINVNNTYYYYAPTRNDVAMITVYIENDSGTAISPSDVGDFRMARIEYMENTDAPTDCITLSFANTGSFRVYIEAYGYYQFNKTNVKYQINSTGKSLTWDNPLVGSQERALLIAEFVGNYLQSNISYNYKYRGNPELNANDIIKQENDFVSNMQVVVGEHKIGFNGALSGEITARRRLTE